MDNVEYYKYCMANEIIDKNILIDMIKEHFSKTKLHGFIANVICSGINAFCFDRKIKVLSRNEYYVECINGYDKLNIKYDGGIEMYCGKSSVQYLCQIKPGTYYDKWYAFNFIETDTIGVYTESIYEMNGFAIDFATHYFKFGTTISYDNDTNTTIEIYKNKCMLIKKMLNSYLINDLIDMIRLYMIEFQILKYVLDFDNT